MMWMYPDMNNVCPNNYMMKFFPCLGEVAFTCYVDVWSVKVCGLMKGLLSICAIMGIHIYIELVD